MRIPTPFIRPWAAALIAGAVLGGPGAAAAQEQLYWTQSGPGGFMTNGPAFVMQAALDGSGAAPLVQGTGAIKGPNGLESGAGALYWPDQQLGAVHRADFDGASAAVPFTSDNVYDVSVSGDRVFWVNGSGGQLKSARLDGSDARVVMAGLNFPVAVQATDSHLYWTEYFTGQLRRANLDGSGAVSLISGGLDFSPFDFEVTDDSLWYFGRNAGNLGGIWRADLDGSHRTEVITDPVLKKGIEVTDDAVWWTSAVPSGSSTAPAIRRMALDGSGVQNVLVGSQGVSFHGVVVTAPVSAVPEPASALLAGAGLALLASRLRRARRAPQLPEPATTPSEY